MDNHNDSIPPVPTEKNACDPSWWRLNRGIPFLVLLLVAAAADYFCPALCEGGCLIGFGTSLGTLLFVAALLLLRKDFSRGEQVFLVLFSLLSAAAQAFSGSVLCWLLVPAICLMLVHLPRVSGEAQPKGRSWWSFWLARRPSASKAKAFSGTFLPLVVCLAVSLVLFFGFLAIFAEGNPVVHRAFELICEHWNKVLDFLHLDATVWVHAFVWAVGIAVFGFFTAARRPAAVRPERMDVPAGRPILPHLPSFALAGINAAFAIATSTDILFLWFRRIPEGISQTAYLHQGADSIIWASVLAAGLLVFLFRNGGNARRSLVARGLAHLLVLQTALLAVSVFLRLAFQIEDYGFTCDRLTAVELMLGGLVGIALLLSYIRGGQFLRHLRIGCAALVLLFVTANIQPPSSLAGDLNLLFLDSHPHWKFETADFHRPTRFDTENSLAFADRFRQETELNDIRRFRDAAAQINYRHQGNWRLLTVNALRFRELADTVYQREDKRVEAEFQRFLQQKEQNEQ
ncbi:MAG: DUF4173 domain-containing protein [Akkermansia sp.]|nr:DUF4173 domain-containing protein [Akkermansia sp.]